jgi:hypothetical protein
MGQETQTAKLAKIAGRTPAEVGRRAELSPEALPLLEAARGPESFLRALLERECWADAVKFLAHALPKREAVWWGVLAVRSQLGEPPSPEATAILAASERWVRQPTDEHRRAAMALAEPHLGDPASLVGVAAFMSGDSLAPVGVEPVPPPEHLTGTMVANAVILSAVGGDALAAPARYRGFLAKGLEIAKGPAR